MSRKARRAPHVISLWRDGVRVVQAAGRTSAVPATPLLLELLDRLDQWRTAAEVATILELPGDALAVLLDGLHAHGIVDLATGSGEEVGPPPPVRPPFSQWAPAAALFHHATRDVPFAREERTAPSVPQAPRPPAELPALGAPRVPLPMPRLPGRLADALQARRTHRQFSRAPLHLQDVATLLGATFGVQAWAHPPEGPLALKTSPSGGARHSLEAYVWVRRVTGLPPGLYHYRPGDHALTAMTGGAPQSVADWLPTQEGYEHAPLLVVLASELERVAWRYRSARAYRVVLIEAGHLGQTFCLTASALGLAPFCTAALADSAIERALGLDGSTRPAVYVLGAGRPRGGPWQPHAGRPAPPLVLTALGRALAAPLSRRSGGLRRRPRRGRAR